MKDDVDAELEFHFAETVETLVAQGWSEADARAEAHRRFGDRGRYRQVMTTIDNAPPRRLSAMFTGFLQDVRICLRTLRRAPVLAATIVLTVGLGIGATTTIFGAAYAGLIRPLPYQDSERLVRIMNRSPGGEFPFSLADYLALSEQQTTFTQVATITGQSMNFTDGRTAERVPGALVSWTYFRVLAIAPSMGRDFEPSDSQPGRLPALLISRRFWLNRLASDPDVLGKTVRLDGAPHVVVGVLPDPSGPLERRPEFFVAAQFTTPPRKGPFYLTVYGRLPSESARGAATAELGAIARRIFPVWKSTFQDEAATWIMKDLKTTVVGDSGRVTGFALAAVALVWLIACANASNLLIARVAGRRRELAVRAALGASRARVARHLLTESAVLAIAAAAVGVGLAALGTRAVREFGVDYLPRASEIALDGAVLGFLGGVTAASLLLFGLVPALQGAGGGLDEALRSAGRGATGTRRVRRLRRLLVGAQFGVVTPLLICAALLFATLSRLQRVDVGFDPRNLISAPVVLPASSYATPDQIAAFWERLRIRMASVPGVQEVAFSDSRPPDDTAMGNNFVLEDGKEHATPWVSASPEYFKVLGLRLEQGRTLEDLDGRPGSPNVVVVDRAWSKRFFPAESAIGKRFRQGGCPQCPWTTVVGVVSDVKYTGLGAADDGVVYWPMAGRGNHPMMRVSSRFRYLLVRTDANPSAVTPAVRAALRELDPALPFSPATAEDLLSQSVRMPRLLSALAGSFAVVALVLSIVGIYGVMVHYVQQHAKDISVRLALGGTPGGVLRAVIGDGLRVVAIGVVAGIAAALWLTRFLSGLLFGVSPADPITFAGVGVVLLLTALIACLIPGRRAARLQPAAVLRSE